MSVNWGEKLPHSLFHFVFTPEALDTARRIHQFLFSGVIRMARRADIEMERIRGRSRLERITARALDSGDIKIGVNILLHDCTVLTFLHIGKTDILRPFPVRSISMNRFAFNNRIDRRL